jgi:hypothetical protein
MLAFLDSVLALDDGEYAKIAMLDCIVDAGSTGTNNWFSKLSELLTHSPMVARCLLTHCILMGL